MPRTSLASPTTDEIIALLKKTSLPTVIIEGSDDLIIYKRLETRFYDKNVSVLPVGGRTNVLSIYDRLNELPSTCQVFFIADKDNWVITGVPTTYQSPTLLLTDGYSIENDVFRDTSIQDYMSPEERQHFNGELSRFLSWYAIALSRHLSNGSEELKLHPNHILDDESEYNRLTTLNVGEHFPHLQLATLTDDYRKLLRGKSLMQLAMRQLSYTGRTPKHTDKAFIEHAAVRPGPLIEGIFGAINSALG